MVFQIILLSILNIIDGWFTWFAIKRDYGQEINPLMDFALHHGPIFFFILKILLMTGGICGIVYAFRRRPRAIRISLWAAIGLYLSVCIYHVAMVGYLLIFIVPKN